MFRNIWQLYCDTQRFQFHLFACCSHVCKQPGEVNKLLIVLTQYIAWHSLNGHINRSMLHVSTVSGSQEIFNAGFRHYNSVPLIFLFLALINKTIYLCVFLVPSALFNLLYHYADVTVVYWPMAEEATESKRASLLNWSDFLLHKLHSYGEALNLRGAMSPLFPPPMLLAPCRGVIYNTEAMYSTLCVHFW